MQTSIIIIYRTKSPGYLSEHHTDMAKIICPGEILTYSCTIVGTPGGHTLWTGSAFDCPDSNNEITLIHSRFTANGSAYGECNNGAITAQSNSSGAGGIYSSFLSVNISASISGKSIMCLHHTIEDEIAQFEWGLPTTGFKQ